MIWLVRLYPKRWRERYAGELEQLVRDLRPDRGRLGIALDLMRGALGAHVRQGIEMNVVHRRATLRAVLIAAVVWFGLAVEIVLSNVVLASRADDDAILVIVSYLCVFGALFLTGLVAANAGASRAGQAAAGVIAGVLIGLLTAATFAVVDNVWLDVVAQQQSKIEGFAHSGAATMREFINHELIGVAIVLPVAFGIIGAMLGAAGGLFGRGATQSPRMLRPR